MGSRPFGNFVKKGEGHALASEVNGVGSFGLCGRGVGALATSSVVQDAYSVSRHMGNLIHKVKQLKSWSCPVLPK